MNIIYTGRNVEVTDALRAYAEKKILRLEKMVDTPASVQVTFVVEKKRNVLPRERVEVIFPMKKYLLRAEEEAEDMYAAIDLVYEKLERQVKKYKAKLNREGSRENIRYSSKNGGFPEIQESTLDEVEEDVIVKNKRFVLKPMMEEEAALQMDLLGHDFFVFRNGKSEEVNVIYKRKDGRYGLIEPQV